MDKIRDLIHRLEISIGYDVMMLYEDPNWSVEKFALLTAELDLYERLMTFTDPTIERGR